MGMKAVIFDMDGTISDTQSIHAEIESQTLAFYGIQIHPEEITKKYAGTSDSAMFGEIFKAHNISTPFKEGIEKKWELMEKLPHTSIKPMDGIFNLIDIVIHNGYRIGLASSSRLSYIRFVLQSLKIREKFEAVSSADEVEESKPNPEIFLITAKKLNVKPIDCLVIEDSYSGLLAAKRAGMKGIGLVDSMDKRSEVADFTVKKLHEITLEKIKQMIG
jgi:HAD superfamily hydrolase (TIGR01509 family)